MKNLYGCGIVLLACLSISWTEPSTTKPLPQPPLPAFSFTTNEVVDFETIFPIPCTDEEITLTGRLHVLYHITINNNSIVVKNHFQPQGITGLSSSGVKYQGTGVTQNIFKGSLINNQLSFTSVNNFRLVGQGQGNNYLVHATLHTTINANGDVPAEVDNASIDCK